MVKERGLRQRLGAIGVLCSLVFLPFVSVRAQSIDTFIGQGQPRKELTVAVNSAPPYRIIEENRYQGIYIDVMAEVARRAQIDFHFIEVPLARAFVMMSTGEADIMLGPNRSDDREAVMLFLDPPFPAEDKAFYIPQDAPDITSFADLKGKTVAVLRGAVYFDAFDTDPLLRRTSINDYAHGLQMVEARRVDAIIMPRLQGDYLTRELKLAVRIATYKVPGRVSYVAMSRQSHWLDRKDEIERELSGVFEDGTFEKIVARYR